MSGIRVTSRDREHPSEENDMKKNVSSHESIVESEEDPKNEKALQLHREYETQEESIDCTLDSDSDLSVSENISEQETSVTGLQVSQTSANISAPCEEYFSHRATSVVNSSVELETSQEVSESEDELDEIVTHESEDTRDNSEFPFDWDIRQTRRTLQQVALYNRVGPNDRIHLQRRIYVPSHFGANRKDPLPDTKVEIPRPATRRLTKTYVKAEHCVFAPRPRKSLCSYSK